MSFSKFWSPRDIKPTLGYGRFWSLGLFWWCLLLPMGVAHGATIEVSLDRNPVPINESFTLTLSADEAPDDDPDLSPLRKDFEILNQSQSNQFSMVNGKTTRQVSWQIQLIAKAPGALEIPAIAFGKDHSRPFMVTVTPGAVSHRQGGDESLFLEMEADPPNPYVQAQVILTVRVLSRVAFSGDLAQPEVPGATLEKLDDDRQYMALRNGVQFRVDERRYTLYPEKSGRLTIPPVNMTAEVGGGGGPFARSRGRQQRLHSDSVVLDVRPVPASFRGSTWLPAARLELLEQWTPTNVKIQAGEPLTRTLTLTAEGASVGMLPELAGVDIPGGDVRQYPDQPVTKEEKGRTGLVSLRQQKTAFLTVKPGSYKIPAVEIPWWNTVKDQMEVVKVPAHEVTVLPVADGGASSAPPGVPEIPKEVPAALPQAPLPSLPEAKDGAVGFWRSASWILGFGWLATVFAWWWTSRRRGVQVPDHRETLEEASPKTKALLKSLETACLEGDPVRARRALDAWAQAKWPERSSVARLEQLESGLGDAFRELNRRLYAQAEGPWDGHPLLTRVQSMAALKRDTQAPVNDVLASLHKL